MEIQRRAALAYATALPLKAPFFNKQSISFRAKATIGAAIMLAQSTYAAQTWPKLNKTTEKTFARATLRIYKTIHGKQQSPRPLSDIRIAADIGMLQPKDYLRQQRLQYSKRALEHAPAALFALLQAEAKMPTSFYAMLSEDIKWMRKNTPIRISPQDLSLEPEKAIAQIANFEPKVWRKCVKQAVAIAKERQKQRADLEDFHAAYVKEAREAGLHIHISTSLAKAEQEAIQSKHLQKQVPSRSCTTCNSSFEPVQKLKLHQYRVHGIKHPLRLHIVGNSCLCCLKYFHTRNRV